MPRRLRIATTRPPREDLTDPILTAARIFRQATGEEPRSGPLVAGSTQPFPHETDPCYRPFMRRVMALALVVIAGASCSTAIRWEKSGAGDAERQRDETECTARASRESTVSTAQSVGTTYGSPLDSQRTRIQPYDADLFDECMRTRGYERVPARPPA